MVVSCPVGNMHGHGPRAVSFVEWACGRCMCCGRTMDVASSFSLFGVAFVVRLCCVRRVRYALVSRASRALGRSMGAHGDSYSRALSALGYGVGCEPLSSHSDLWRWCWTIGGLSAAQEPVSAVPSTSTVSAEVVSLHGTS